MSKQKLIVLIGPTAVGKTELSINLAKEFNGEIISGDSMQVYKGMDIGTAKITREEMQNIPHHLLDIKDPAEPFSAAEFQKIVRGKISEINRRSAIPMIVGGTGLYIQSVLYDYHFPETPKDEQYRQKLEEIAEQKGKDFLYKQLLQLDPAGAEKIHPNNVRRVIRALEVYHLSGKAASEYQKEQEKEMLYDTALIGLTMEREKLYKRINQRVDLMLEQGLIEEVTNLYRQNLHDAQSIQAIGYKEIYDYLEGKHSLKEAIRLLKQNTRHFAKRQLTWFRNKMDIEWFDMTDDDEKAKKILEISKFIAGKLKLKSNRLY